MQTPLRTVFACCALFLVAGTAHAQAIQRCEGGGKVTYSNGPCPPGTQPARTLAPSPGPNVADEKAARERAQRDARELDRIERERKAEEARAEKQRQALAKKEEARARECRKLELRLAQAKDALARATLAKRAEAERKARRAEEQYELQCRKG
ncbi:DUF4124 domain-containing protein [Betaproteobacteria bacterium PRO7]|jgi:hypothetical protein|nr:DUF4124 domain-containing protein [Burkholderiaceae bacterium]MDL1859397.1 DUF4124 domain-containing protein [Betaproteobacteria bacterium PRO7]